MEYKDYYQVLGVPKTATQAEIKKAYRRLARELHPDRNPGDAAAEQRFKDANEAHAVLSDAEKRRRYDELGANWQAYQQTGYDPGSASSWSSFGGAPGGTQWTYRTSSGDDLGGFSDFFRVFFGGTGEGGPFASGGDSPFASGGGTRVGGRGGGFEFVDLSDLAGGPQRRGAPQAPPRRGTAGEATAEVTLDEVARGTERLVNVDGRRLQVKIPPGVADGSRVRLRGALDGGDVVIIVRVRPDRRFTREGADLRTELPITLAEALLGAEVPVPTPTGSVKLRIRPNTQYGQEIRLAGRGLPRRGGGSNGDLVVTTRVVVPRLDEEARDEFERFATSHPQPNPRERMN